MSLPHNLSNVTDKLWEIPEFTDETLLKIEIYFLF